MYKYGITITVKFSQEGYVSVVVCLSVCLSICLLAILHKTFERIYMKFSGKLAMGQWTND